MTVIGAHDSTRPAHALELLGLLQSCFDLKARAKGISHLSC